MNKRTTLGTSLLLITLSFFGLLQMAGASGPTVSISAIPSTTTPQLNSNFTVEFRMNTDNHNVTVVGVTASYSDTLEFVSADSSGSNWTTDITNPTPNTQTRTFRLERANFNGVNSANALITKITFKALSAGTGTITIDNQATEVYESDTNLFNQQSTPTSVTIAAASTPTPTPTPTATPTVAPTSTPTPNGNIGGNNDPVATPTPTSQVTNTPTPAAATPTPTTGGTTATPTPQATQSTNTTSTPTPTSTSSNVATATTPTPKPNLIQSIFKPKATPTPKPTTIPTVVPTITSDGQPTALPTFIFTYEPVPSDDVTETSGTGRIVALGLGLLLIILALVGVWFAYRKHDTV